MPIYDKKLFYPRNKDVTRMYEIQWTKDVADVKEISSSKAPWVHLSIHLP